MKLLMKLLFFVVAPAVFIAVLMSSEPDITMQPAFIFGTLAAMYIWFQTQIIIFWKAARDDVRYLEKKLDKGDLLLEQRVEELERKLEESDLFPDRREHWG